MFVEFVQGLLDCESRSVGTGRAHADKRFGDGEDARFKGEFANGLCALQFPGPTLLGDPPQPRPELLTEDEAIRYLRLDTIDISEPSATLRRYRQRGLLRGTRISKRIFYRRAELNRFIERVTESNPR